MEQNEAHYGGALCCKNGPTCSVTSESVIRHNVATGGGGGLWIENINTELILKNSSVEYNRATSGNGGGISVFNGALCTIASSIIQNNTASGYGGGIIVRQTNSKLVTISSIKIQNPTTMSQNDPTMI